jgi:hypothetical protein
MIMNIKDQNHHITMTDKMQEGQDAALSFDENQDAETFSSEKVVVHVEDDDDDDAAETSNDDDDDDTMTPSEQEAEIVVAPSDEEWKEMSCPNTSLLDQELDVTESRDSETVAKESTCTTAPPEQMDIKLVLLEREESQKVAPPEENVEDEEGHDRILRTASSDSTASSEIPPPPPPEHDSSVASEEDVPTDEEDTSPSKKKLGNNETALPESTSTEVPPPSSSPSKKNDLSTNKTKVAARLVKAIEDSESHDHRSPELVPLTKEYQNLRKRLRSLIASAKAYQAATRQVEQARSKVRCR